MLNLVIFDPDQIYFEPLLDLRLPISYFSSLYTSLLKPQHMKTKVSFAILLLNAFQITVSSQPCLPEGIIFNTQAQIDSFQFNYPNCSEIEGDVRINGGYITNLMGLNVLISIGGDLYINTLRLDSLSGLENLASIGGDLYIIHNHQLTDLSGLEGLNSIEGSLYIYLNDALVSITGIDNVDAASINDLYIFRNPLLSMCNIPSMCDFLVSPGGSVNIYDNAPGCNSPPDIADACGLTLPCLPFGNYYFRNQQDIDNFQTNFTGCTLLEGDVFIRGNDITNLNGLNVLTYIHGNLKIGDLEPANPNLTSLAGLENLNSIGGSLSIDHNEALTILTGLEGLTNIDSGLYVADNDYLIRLEGLNNLTSVGYELNISSCPSLTSLLELSNISHVGHTLWIQFNDALTDLSGLEKVTTIGPLKIIGNNSLTSLKGLENINSIGGDASISENNALESLDELENLNTVEGSLGIWYNDNLISLEGLINLTSIGGGLGIDYNNSLPSLEGLDNIDANSITGLYIRYNGSLCICDVMSICEYLKDPNGDVCIWDNMTGCNSWAEVEEACEAVGQDENFIEGKHTVYPNPPSDQLIFQFYLNKPSKVKIEVLNNIGQIVSVMLKSLSQGEQQVVWNSENMPTGLYFYHLTLNGEQQTATGKLMVMR
jgi:hypothetical protein